MEMMEKRRVYGLVLCEPRIAEVVIAHDVLLTQLRPFRGRLKLVGRVVFETEGVDHPNLANSVMAACKQLRSNGIDAVVEQGRAE